MHEERRRTGPVILAYDGTKAAENAIREAGTLLRGKAALVITVWKAGLGFELMELPTATIGLPPATVDIHTALEIDKASEELAERTARHGAWIAHSVGFAAEGLAVGDLPEIEVAETIVRIAGERDAQATVVGAHGHGIVSDVLVGGTTREVIRHAPCPVLVVRERKDE